MREKVITRRHDRRGTLIKQRARELRAHRDEHGNISLAVYIGVDAPPVIVQARRLANGKLVVDFQEV